MVQEIGSLVEGRYRLVALLGEGGMGAAWHAHDERMRRDVALKQLRLPPLSPEARTRFVARMEREARAAGMLRHPGVITVYDQFRDEQDLPWIVMELIRGPSLDGRIRSGGPLPPPEAARIGVRVASALAAAHAAGIVHRDVKPANILLEGDRVVLTDFGIAAVTGEAVLTETGMVLGTPAYMAPEQARGQEATPASDVWSLGATLYAAVEGRPPFQAPHSADLVMAVRRARPDPPRNAGPLTPALRALMQADPSRRPTAETAAALLSTAPGPPTTPPSLSVPTPSRRTVLLGAGASAAAIALAVPAVVFLTRDDPGSGDPGTKTSTGTERPGERVSQAKLWSGSPTSFAPLEGHTDGVWSLAFNPDGKLLASGGGKEDRTVRLWDTEARVQKGEPLKGHTDAVFSAVFSPDGRLLATSGSLEDATVRLWDVAARAPVGAPMKGHTDGVWEVAFSPDGSRLASCSQDGTVRWWETATRDALGTAVKAHTGPVTSLAFSPDGKLLASGSQDRRVHLWDTASRTVTGAALEGHTDAVWSVAFSPDGKLLATADEGGTIRFWDVASRAAHGAPLQTPGTAVWSVAFSPDGSLLAGAYHDAAVRLWDTASRAAIGSPLKGHASTLWAVAFSPGGSLLASAGHDRAIRLWHP